MKECAISLTTERPRAAEVLGNERGVEVRLSNFWSFSIAFQQTFFKANKISFLIRRLILQISCEYVHIKYFDVLLNFYGWSIRLIY